MAAASPPRAAPAPAAATTSRLFVALWPGAAVRRALVARQSAIAWPAAARLVPPRDLHLTLVFIGALPADRLAEVADALALQPPRFELVIDSAEFWRGGLTVLTASRVPPAMIAWQAAMTQTLRRLGLSIDERRFKPHVTLARHGEGARLAQDRPLEPTLWSVAGHVLAGRVGAHYRVLRRYGRPAA